MAKCHNRANKNLSLREITDTTLQVSAPPGPVIFGT